ncbi:DUF2043 domain-containing protein [Cephalotus follicularis]|uniref:DUF2043 domain-containing protein n=1 Tax=Cephalotus follicularis TaxID=3775 RepID=A0A1Q3D1V4_CEPFO|nr:DUF2043 domain-containing protein [Cephalotus follicularis]
MEEAREGGGGGKVRALIEKATNSTAAEVDPRILKAIKSVVRSSDSELRLAARTLLDLMKRDHSQVRYLTLVVIDELFIRSKLFRSLLVENLDQLLTLSVGFRRNLPLPPPPAVASRLRSKAIEFLEKWNASFGVHYRQLRLGFDYLKNTLRFQFPNLQANAARIQQERRERETRTKEILRTKFETLRANLPSIKEEIQSTVDEIGQCLNIILTQEESMPLAPLDDEDFVEFRSSELQQLRLDSLKEGEKVCENSDNKVVFDTLRELYKLLMTNHLISVQELISVLIRVEGADNRYRDSALKELIDIRNRLISVKKKCEESGCASTDAVKHWKEKEEEDFWEECKNGPFENGSSSTPIRQNGDLDVASNSSKVKNEAPERSKENTFENELPSCEGGITNAFSLKSKLLAEAPVMQWGSYLNNWGSNMDILANQRGMEFESHWGRVDYDAVIPADKIAELNIQATIYKEDQVEIPPCHAPLSTGALCQRRDLRVCPFHGPIIPRDDEGNPIHQSTSMDKTTLDLQSNLVGKLAKQAVMNVRDADKEEERKRENNKRSVKRAKLARIREHNEAVLRDAAMASTSRSADIGEDVEVVKGDKSLARNKKQTLASMLHKKVTTKDRIAQKLLNSRVKDSTVKQLALGEDTNYREAFPNQW